MGCPWDASLCTLRERSWNSERSPELKAWFQRRSLRRLYLSFDHIAPQQTLQSVDKLEEYCFKHPNDLVMNEVGELLGAQ
jgi:hypothetical protein